MKYPNIREEELKNKIAQDYFWLYDCTKIIGNVDFCVSMLHSNSGVYHLHNDNGVCPLVEQESLLWAEAKKGSSNIYESFVQLVLTIGKARTFDKYLPPAFLSVFDGEKMAFIPYSDIHDVFYLNDFNWNVAPSNYETKEFKLVYEKVKSVIDNKTLLFNYIKDDAELRRFIKNNLAVSKQGISKIKIDKNNFTIIYNKWLQTVKPTIAVDWEVAKKNAIFDSNFYLADLLSQENKTLKEKLYVVLNKDHYIIERKIDEQGLFNSKRADFSDNQVAHTQFWNRYERPPKTEYWDYIVKRNDLLVPQDVRERKGSFFTPAIWVELAQQYLADVLGEDWQDEYYVWDCCAGTGNLLAGLTNAYHIYASTLDKADVAIMKDRIQNGANLLESHVFQFDFLNDDFSKLPKSLLEIINDPKKRKKLVVFINPPYAESTSYGTHSKTGVSSENKTYEKYKKIIGIGINEIFVQFFMQILTMLPDCKLASFSKLKFVNSQNFIKFRNYFEAEYQKGFICRANSFDNVSGKFPIGFLIWDLAIKKRISELQVDVYENDREVKQALFSETKKFFPVEKGKTIIDWLRIYFDKKAERIGYLRIQGTDMQQNNTIFITSKPSEADFRESKVTEITKNNLIQVSIYFAVRKVIPATWLNDRDQFLYPNEGWKTDLEFQNDCLAYTLFNTNIQSKHGINDWIPFREYDVGAKERFFSHFMTDFIHGKPFDDFVVSEPLLFYDGKEFGGGGSSKNIPRKFSETAKKVFRAGRDLWKYYHTTISSPKMGEVGRGEVNASLYDIKEHFQGRNEKGNMNTKSNDEKYNELIGILRDELKLLAEKIEPKVYEYGFLKR